MTKGFLLASACALSLLAAPAILHAQNAPGAPTNAYGGSSGTSATGASGNGTAGNPSTNQNVHGSMTGSDMGTTGQETKSGTRHAWHGHGSAHGGRTDTSQNAAVDQLNQQSLMAAEQGRPFSPGSSSGSLPGTGNPGATGTSGSGMGTNAR